MPEYMSKELFLASMGLRGDETKYGNTDAEHQHRSYSTYMSYEIMDCVEDSEVEDVVAVVRCKDCKYRSGLNGRPPYMFYICTCAEGLTGAVPENHFCSYGERRDAE